MLAKINSFDALVSALFEKDNGAFKAQGVPQFKFGFLMEIGNLIDQCNRGWSGRVTIANNSTPNDSVDLSGTLVDPAGDPVTFGKVCFIGVKNLSVTAGEIITVGAHPTANISAFVGTNPGVKIGPKGGILIFDPSLAAYTVTNSSSDILRLAVAAGTNVAADVLVLGRDA